MNKLLVFSLLLFLAGCSVEQPVDASDPQTSADWIARCHKMAAKSTTVAEQIGWKTNAYDHAEQAGLISQQEKVLPDQVLALARKTRNKEAFSWAIDNGAIPPTYYNDLKEYTSLRGVFRERVLEVRPGTLPTLMSLAVDINNVEFFDSHAAEMKTRGFEVQSPLDSTEFKMRYRRLIAEQLLLALEQEDADRIRFLVEMTPEVESANYLDEETADAMRASGDYVFSTLKDEELAVMMVNNHYAMNPIDFETQPFGEPFLQAFGQDPEYVIQTQGFETWHGRMSDIEVSFLLSNPEKAWDLLPKQYRDELSELSMKFKESDAPIRLIKHKESKAPLTQFEYNELISWALKHGNDEAFDFLSAEAGEMDVFHIDFAALALNQELFMLHAPKIMSRIYYTMDTNPRPDGTTLGRIKQAFGCGNEDAGLWIVYKYNLSEGWKKATNGQTLLMDVCAAGNLKAAKYLIENRGENVRDQTGHSELEISVFGSNRPTEGKMSAIFFAANSGNSELIRYLASKGASVNAYSNFRTTPLMHAVSAGHLDATKTLIELRANVNAQMSSSLNSIDLRAIGSYDEISTALQRARSTGNQEMIDLLIKAGAR